MKIVENELKKKIFFPVLWVNYSFWCFLLDIVICKGSFNFNLFYSLIKKIIKLIAKKKSVKTTISLKKYFITIMV